MTIDDDKEKIKNTLIHKIMLDKSLHHLYNQNERHIKLRVDEFAASKSIYDHEDINDFSQSLRRDIYESHLAPKESKRNTYKILPGRLPDDICNNSAAKESKVHPQDILDFMYRKQEETRANFRRERKEAQNKTRNHRLDDYIPPPSNYVPPNQVYHRDRPYIQEYIRYKNDLRPVVMPVFTHPKGSIRAKAKSSYMPKSDPNRVSKRDQYFNDRLTKVQEEAREGEVIKKLIRSKKRQESKRLPNLEQELSIIASPIKSSRPSTSLQRSHSSPATADRPGTCNSFSPAALKMEFERPDYPTAGKFWITDI